MSSFVGPLQTMKHIAVLALAVALLIGSATTALAASRTSDEAVALPAHGSVWFGSGLAQFDQMEAQPLHGSVWFGSGLAQFVDTEAQPLHGSVWFGNGLAQYGVQIAPVNSFDTAMIARGAAHDQGDVQSAVLAQAPVNSFDEAMLQRGPARGWLAQRGIVQVTH